MVCCSTLSNMHQLEYGTVVFQFSQNLVAQLGCSEALMNSSPVYLLCFGPVILFPCSHEMCGILGSPSMIWGSSLNNILNLEHDLVVLQFSPNLVPQLGCSEAYTNSMLVY